MEVTAGQVRAPSHRYAIFDSAGNCAIPTLIMEGAAESLRAARI